MTTPDYKALCAELIDALDSGFTAGRIRMSPLADRARAALAAEPDHLPDARKMVEPAAGEVAELVAWMRDIASIGYGRLARAADLLERLAPQPVPEGPTDDELYEIWNLEGNEADFQDCRRFARAVLARWGQP
jgi:hypothetical protein